MLIFRDLFLSPLLHAFMLFSLLFALLFAGSGIGWWTPATVNTILDCFTFSAAALIAIRYGPRAWEALRSLEPTGPQVLVASLYMVSISVGLLRALRLIGLDLGIIHSTVLAYLFGAITVMMVFGLFLKVAAPAGNRDLIVPWRAFWLALGTGSIISGIVGVIKWMIR